jgi:predicted negative regulator of RcsB-dependent stress response
VAETIVSPKGAQKGALKDARLQSSFELQERLGAFLEANWTSVVAGLAVIAIGSLLYASYDYFTHRAEAKAEDALYLAESPYVKAKEGFDKAKMKALMPAFGESDESGAATAKPATGDLEKDYGSSVAGLEGVIDAYPKSHAAQQAGLDLASIYLDYKQPDKAAAAIVKATATASAKDVIGALALTALGDVRAAQGQCEAAIAAWKRILDEPRAAYLHGELTVKTGVCYENLKQNDKALEAYRKTTQDFGDTAAARTARSLMRAIELRGPELAPAPASGASGASGAPAGKG